MDAELKRKWVEALRSGEYAQCREAYEADGGYCCLGVFSCVVKGRELSETECADIWDPKKYGVDVRDAHTLMRMNDRGDNFAVIADFIEANL